MKNMKTILPVAAFSIALLAGPAQAIADDDTGFYIGAGVSALSADFEDENDVNFDDSDTAPGLRLGYMFNNLVGVEVGYQDFGDYSAPGDSPENRIDLDAEAFSAAIVLNWAVHDKIDIYTKAGAYFIEAESNSVVAGNSFNAGDDTTEAFAAFGVEWDLGNFNVFGEISKVDTDVNELTVDIVTAGVKYEF